MAQKVEVRVVISDDLDGTEGAETILFGWQGKNYEIDLSEVNAKEFENLLSTYLAHARPIAASKSNQPKLKGPTADEIREWARGNGLAIADKGRIPAEVRDAYKAAHP